jgi:hypothetical protein
MAEPMSRKQQLAVKWTKMALLKGRVFQHNGFTVGRSRTACGEQGWSVWSKNECLLETKKLSSAVDFFMELA